MIADYTALAYYWWHEFKFMLILLRTKMKVLRSTCSKVSNLETKEFFVIMTIIAWYYDIASKIHCIDQQTLTS